MRRETRTVQVILLIFLTIILCGNCKYARAAENTVKIAFVGVDHSPLVAGESESFYLTSLGAKKVKYRVFLNNISINKTVEITSGYTESVDATKPYIVKPNDNFKLGKYKIIVWVKEENSVKKYDNEYTTALSCVGKDSNNRVYSSGDINITNDVYTVGEKVLINGIKNISGMKGPYAYKVHVYDTETDEWTIDNKGYRNNLEWVPTKPGTYVLVVWDISYNSTLWKTLIKNPESKLHEGWKMKVITINDTSKGVQVSFVGLEHLPLVAGEEEKFYLTSKYAEKVQYRAWVYSENTKTWEDITNGYTPLVDADKPYEISPNKKFIVGKYKLWIWVREEKSLKEYDNYFSSFLNCVEKNNSYNVYTINDMDIDKSTFRVGEKVTVRGIKDISGMNGPYTYKLNILNTETGEWTLASKEYSKQTEWIPTKPGTYILDLWTMSSNSTLWKILNKDPEKKLYEGLKIKVIKVMADNDGGTEVEPAKPYTVVNSFSELYTAIDNKYDVVINDAKVATVYKKAKDIVSNITNSNMSDLEKELAIHEYVVKNTVYDYDNYKNETVPEDSYTAYGALIIGRAVCDGYSDTMKLLLNLAGIEAQVVVGYAGEPHSWNMVKIDGQYYHLDATWDDPNPDEGNKVRYTYFNLSDAELSKDHEWSKDEYITSTSERFQYMQSMYHAVIDSPWIYFSNELDGKKLYKMSLDGKIKAKLNDNKSLYEVTDQQWIYYSNYYYGGYLYKIRKDGLGNTRLNTEWTEDIEVDGDFILYKNVNENRTYKIKKDGSQRQLVN